LIGTPAPWRVASGATMNAAFITAISASLIRNPEHARQEDLAGRRKL
jgi:hypothetical protein